MTKIIWRGTVYSMMYHGKWKFEKPSQRQYILPLTFPRCFNCASTTLVILTSYPCWVTYGKHRINNIRKMVSLYIYMLYAFDNWGTDSDDCIYTALVDWRRYLRLWLLIRYVSPEPYICCTGTALTRLYASRTLSGSPIIWVTIVRCKQWLGLILCQLMILQSSKVIILSL